MPTVLSTPTPAEQEHQEEEALWASLMAASASTASQTTSSATETRYASLDGLSSTSEFSRSPDASTVARRRRRKGALLRRDDDEDEDEEDEDDDDLYQNFTNPDDIPKQLLSIAPSGWADRKHSSDFYAGPVIIAASVVLAVAIIVTLCLIVCFMRRRSTKVMEAEASDTERASLDQEKLDTDHQELHHAAALASEKGSVNKKKGGVLRVTKQRITTVRRRRQARKAPQATGSLTPSETASPPPEPQDPISSSDAQSSAVDLHPAQSRQQPQQEDSEEQTGSSGPSPPDSSDSLPADRSEVQQSTEAVAMPSSPPPPPPPAAEPSAAPSSTSQRPPDPPAYDHPLSARQREKRPAAATEDTEDQSMPPTSSSAAAALALQESLPAPSHAARPDYDPAEYAGHVATDDKAVLAHRNQLASAPSGSNSEERAASSDELRGESQPDLGESAPVVDVDEEGFELHPDSGVPEPSPALPAPPTARPSAFALPSAPFDRPAPEAAGTLPPSSPDLGSPEASAPDFGLGDAHHDARPQAEPSAPHLPWMPLPTYEAEESSAPPLPLEEEEEADHTVDAEHHRDVQELSRPEQRSRTPSHSSAEQSHHSSNRQAGIDV